MVGSILEMGNSGSASKCPLNGLSHAGFCLAVLTLISYPQSHLQVGARTIGARPHGDDMRLHGDHVRSHGDHFTAAVYEHVPVAVPDRVHIVHQHKDFDYARSVIASNLDVYLEQVISAHSQGAHILVFPEYGLTGLGRSRAVLREMAEQVPDPRETSSNPCQAHAPPVGDSGAIVKAIKGESLPVEPEDVIQWSLSCMARQYEMYVAVNMPSWIPCDIAEDPGCPEDEFYLYNTNIVYNDEGYLVGRYHKWTLYYETALNQPKTVEHDYFDTPFGRIGTFVCFDILFERPAIDLVEEFGIDTALFPTAWQSKLPLMQGVGFHESWSILTGVNLLGSELHVPVAQFAGSGIYAGANGAVRYYFDDDILSPGKLLVADIPIRPTRPVDVALPPPRVVEEDFDIFESDMRGDLYRFVALDWESHEIYIEYDNTTCFLSYSFSYKDPQELYAFAVFQGMHYSAHNSYLQVCALVKCADIHDRDTCGDSVKYADSVFDHVIIHGQFSTKYVFPSVVIDGGVPTGNRSGWDFTTDATNERSMIEIKGLDDPLVYATLYGRIYERDTEDDDDLLVTVNKASRRSGFPGLLFNLVMLIGVIL